LDFQPLSDLPSEADLSSYCRWQDIFRSWFWRYYDNLFKFVIFNLGWFSVCFGVSWLSGRIGLLNLPTYWHWFGVFTVYLLESIVTFFWALLVFMILMEVPLSWPQYKKYVYQFFLKGQVISILSGLFLGLSLLNIRFYSSFQGPAPIWALVLMGFVITLFLYGLMMTFYLWPILFFQDPPLGKLLYRAFIVTLGSGPASLLILFVSGIWVLFFTLVPFLWFTLGFVLLFALYCTALEKHLLLHRITFNDKPVEEVLQTIEDERKRNWRDILKPWENR
jgi:hypothetical protein